MRDHPYRTQKRFWMYRALGLLTIWLLVLSSVQAGADLEGMVAARYVRFRVTDTVEPFWAVYINEFQVFAAEE